MPRVYDSAMHSLTMTLRLALRGLLRSRGVTLVAMLTLGGGLAAAVLVLGFTDAAVRPLPVPDGRNVVAVEVRDARARVRVPDAPAHQWADAPGVLAAGAVNRMTATVATGDFAPRRASGAAMHPAVLQLLDVPPAAGRLPTDAEDDAQAMVLGWTLYQEFGADPSLLGARMDVDGVPHTLVGVMPDGFGFPERHAFWTVLPPDGTGEVVARLAPGASRSTAAAALAARLDNAVFGAAAADGAPHRVALKSWTTSREAGRDEDAILGGLAMLVVLLLVVCCANVATLLLVRATERSGMLAVQRALGATNARVTLQMLAESALIAVGGGIAGLAGGALLLRWAELRLSSHWGYYWMAMEVRLPVLLGTAALVMVAALLAGIMPALHAGRQDPAVLLAGAGRNVPRQRRLGRWIVGGQVALSSLGMIAAIYLAVEFGNIGRTTERLPLDHVAVARLTLPDGAHDDVGSRALLAERLRSELGRIPGVANVSVSGGVPGGRPGMASLVLPGADPDADSPRVLWAAADENMLDVYRMRLLAGSNISDADAGRVLVTDGIARTWFDGSAVGRHIRLEGVHGDDVWAEIAGVVQDWMPDHRGAAVERVFVPMADSRADVLYVSLATVGDAGAAIPHVRDAVRRVDERVPVEELDTLRARMDWFLRMMKVIAAFGALGGAGSAVVAGVGLYGVMSFQVRARRRELGIRMAVGAAARRIMGDVIRESVLRIAPGLVVGIGFALVAVPWIASLAGVENYAYVWRLLAISAAAGLALLAIGVAAALEPALRASRLDPQEVLRTD